MDTWLFERIMATALIALIIPTIRTIEIIKIEIKS